MNFLITRLLSETRNSYEESYKDFWNSFQEQTLNEVAERLAILEYPLMDQEIARYMIKQRYKSV